jgi:hypothetical protein
MAATGSLSMAAAGTSPDAFAIAFLLNAAMDIVKVHDETCFSIVSMIWCNFGAASGYA